MKIKFTEAIERKLDGEPVEGVVLGDPQGVPKRHARRAIYHRVLSWEEARKYLEYEINPDDFGNPGVHPIWLWTPTRVIFVMCYDGAICLDSVPRNPTDGNPHLVGFW